MLQRGFSPIIIILIIVAVLIVGGGGYYLATRQAEEQPPATSGDIYEGPLVGDTGYEPLFSSSDVSWGIYQNNPFNFELQYPSSWSVEVDPVKITPTQLVIHNNLSNSSQPKIDVPCMIVVNIFDSENLSLRDYVVKHGGGYPIGSYTPITLDGIEALTDFGSYYLLFKKRIFALYGGVEEGEYGYEGGTIEGRQNCEKIVNLAIKSIKFIR